MTVKNRDRDLLGSTLAMAQRALPGCRFALYTDGEGKGPCVLVLRGDEPVLAQVHAVSLVDALEEAVNIARWK